MKNINTLILVLLSAGILGSCTKNEEYSAESEVEVTGVTLDAESIELEEGDTYTLTATVTPSDADDTSVSWATLNDAVATVSGGTVTAVAAGTTTITVTTTDGGYTASCVVTVTEAVVEATAVSLDESSITIDVGATQTLTATITPSNATDQTLTWTSSDESIATVADGTVTGVAAGSATITVTLGELSASCEVTVVTPVSGISLDQTELEINEGVVYAVGASGAEVAMDADTESGYKLYLNGGTLIAVGGIENNSSISQPYVTTSSWSKSTNYALYSGRTLLMTFKTPSSGGTNLVLSHGSLTSGSSYTLTSGCTISGGTSYFGGLYIENATSTSGGSSTSLTASSSSSSDGGGGGNPGGGGPGGM